MTSILQLADMTTGLKPFEGKKVSRTTLNIGAVREVEIADRELKVDAILRMVVEMRVSGVGHEVEEKSGDLIRVHKAKVVDATFLAWDENDPTDEGVAQ